MTSINTNVDQKALRTTKFPPEFNQKVDTTKINISVIKNWVAGEISKILGFEDDIVIGMLFDLLEDRKNPDIKALQIQLTGFLGKDAPTFCKDLWKLCLSAQESDTGIPQELLEAKKLELIQARAAQDEAAETARRRRAEEDARERELESVRLRESRDRGRGRGGRGGRDSDRRPRREVSRSLTPPRRRGSDEYRRPRDIDTYVPRTSNRYNNQRPRSRSPQFSTRGPGRDSHRTRRRRSRSDSRANSPEQDRPRRRSPVPRHASPPRRYREKRRSISRSPSPPRARRRRERSTSRTRRRRSPSSSSSVEGARTNSRKGNRRRSSTPDLRSSRTPSPRSHRQRRGSITRYEARGKRHRSSSALSSPREARRAKDGDSPAPDKVGSSP